MVSCLTLVALLAMTCFAAAGPDLSDGVSILMMLAEPYGANTSLWFNQFERLGWSVTLTGVKSQIRNCSSLCLPIRVDQTLSEIGSASGFDALVVSTSPGTFRPVAVPAADLRSSEAAFDLIREADADGLTLYTGCSGLLVLGEAGVLAGHTVVAHSGLRGDCSSFAGECVRGGQSQLPIIDANVVTGTSGRFFAQEVPEAILWSLERGASHLRSLDSIQVGDVALSTESVELGEASTGAWAIGTTGSDGALDLCKAGGDVVLVGYTYAGGHGMSDLLVMRCDLSGRVIWSKAVGGPGREYGEGVCLASNGDIVVVGHTTSAGEGADDVLLVRMTPTGDWVWARTYGGDGPDAGYDVTATADGGFALCGRTAAAVDPWSDAFVVRVDGGGDVIWSGAFGDVELERAHAILEGPDGTLYVAGGTTSQGAGNYDAMLLAISEDGDELWQRTHGYAQFDVAEDLILTQEGNLAVVGYGDQEGLDPNMVQIARYDTSGEEHWFERYGQSRSFDYGQGVIQLPGGDYLICGATTAEATTRNDVWLLRVGNTDLLPWEHIVPAWESRTGLGEGNEWASAICQTEAGDVVLAGHTTASGAGLHDVLLMTVDPDWDPGE